MISKFPLQEREKESFLLFPQLIGMNADLVLVFRGVLQKRAERNFRKIPNYARNWRRNWRPRCDLSSKSNAIPK